MNTDKKLTEMLEHVETIFMNEGDEAIHEATAYLTEEFKKLPQEIEYYATSLNDLEYATRWTTILEKAGLKDSDCIPNIVNSPDWPDLPDTVGELLKEADEKKGVQHG